MVILDLIIILAGACVAQIFLRERLPSQKFKDFFIKFTNCSNEIYEKIEYIALPMIGSLLVLWLINPQTIVAQAGAGLTWSTTLVAVYNKAFKKND